MPIIDNGDIIRAVGFVAIYGAYLEDRIAELVEMVGSVISLRDNVSFLAASDQARHLKKAVEDNFNSVSDYLTKQQDLNQVTTTLSAVDSHLKDRHVVIHSTLTAKSGTDEVIRKNRRTGVEEKVASLEVVELANDLFELQSQIDGLKFPVRRLIAALSK